MEIKKQEDIMKKPINSYIIDYPQDTVLSQYYDSCETCNACNICVARANGCGNAPLW